MAFFPSLLFSSPFLLSLIPVDIVQRAPHLNAPTVTALGLFCCCSYELGSCIITVLDVTVVFLYSFFLQRFTPTILPASEPVSPRYTAFCTKSTTFTTLLGPAYADVERSLHKEDFLHKLTHVATMAMQGQCVWKIEVK